MDYAARIEQCLEKAVERATQGGCPPLLSKALHSAVFPGGARLRPQLTLAVAAASGAGDADAACVDGAAAAVELMHCASLVHDDLPCFDDADLRRGKATVHKLYGEEIAVLAGDGLIVQAFQAMADGCCDNPMRLPALTACLSSAVGPSGGIVAGQAWESEPRIKLQEYHCAKTGSLFVGAVSAGALAAGSDPQSWRPLGMKIGEAYQLADDLLDARGNREEAGKPVGQDQNHTRPSAVEVYGLKGTLKRLARIVEEAVQSIPDCEGSEGLKRLIRAQSERLVPADLATDMAAA
ncbi:MAG: polyprenyl synthetase family protein [Pseudomonadota bacterium]